MNSSQQNNTDHRNALLVGTLLDQVYRIESVLGHGGFGITYYAFDEDLENYVAIKEFLPQEYAIRDHDTTVQAKSIRDEEVYIWGLKKFLEEAKNLASIHHPNVVKPLRYFKANNTAYLVMEYAAGESLDVYLEKRDSVLPEALIRDIFLHVLDGLRAVHKKGLLHRDIKPSNIYLRKSASPLLIDFGAARYALGEQSRSLSVVLTPGYAPYEQYTSRGKQGPWTDIYGVGASLYKCMTGMSPVSADDRAQALLDGEQDPYQSVTAMVHGDYSSSLTNLVDTALAFKGFDRPQSIDEFIKKYQGWNIDNQPVSEPNTPNSVTEGDKDFENLTKWVKYFLYLQIIFTVISATFYFMDFQLLSEYPNGADRVKWADTATIARRRSFIELPYFVVCLISGFLILKWIYRTNYNARKLGAHDMKFTPGWSIGWYFVPIFNYWKPYQAMKEIWKASHDPENWTNAPSSSIVRMWWGVFMILNLFITIVPSPSNARVTTIDQLIRLNISKQVFVYLFLVFTFYTLTLVKRIYSAQHLKSDSELYPKYEVETSIDPYHPDPFISTIILYLILQLVFL